jgi:hypothetical protein
MGGIQHIPSYPQRRIGRGNAGNPCPSGSSAFFSLPHENGGAFSNGWNSGSPGWRAAISHLVHWARLSLVDPAQHEIILQNKGCFVLMRAVSSLPTSSLSWTETGNDEMMNHALSPGPPHLPVPPFHSDPGARAPAFFHQITEDGISEIQPRECITEARPSITSIVSEEVNGSGPTQACWQQHKHVGRALVGFDRFNLARFIFALPNIIGPELWRIKPQKRTTVVKRLTRVVSCLHFGNCQHLINQHKPWRALI